MHLREIKCDEEESSIEWSINGSFFGISPGCWEQIRGAAGKNTEAQFAFKLFVFFQSRKFCFPLRPRSQSFGRWLMLLVFHLFSPCCHWKQTLRRLTKGGRTAGTLPKRNHSWKETSGSSPSLKGSLQTAASLFIKESLIINTKTGIRNYHCKNT